MTDRSIVGVDLGGTHVRAGLVRAGVVQQLASRPVSAEGTAGQVLDEICETIDQVLDVGAAAVSCAVPSLVDLEEGVVHEVENIPSWVRMPLKEKLETRYGLPVSVNNDANAFVVGELRYGAGRGLSNIVGITLGTGLGAGVVVEGKLYPGSNCGAGELGEMPYRDGTIQEYCAGPFFHREAGEPGEVVFERARQGDAGAAALFHRFGFEVGHAVMIALLAFDPELVVLGGGISRAWPLFEAGVWERLREFKYRHALARLTLTVSEVENISVLGAAALFLEAGDRPGAG